MSFAQWWEHNEKDAGISWRIKDIVERAWNAGYGKCYQDRVKHPDDARVVAQRPCMCADPENCTVPVPGCRKGQPSEVARPYDAEKLARGIVEAAQRAGIIRGDVPLTGPHLLMLCDDLASGFLGEPGRQPGVARPANVLTPSDLSVLSQLLAAYDHLNIYGENDDWREAAKKIGVWLADHRFAFAESPSPVAHPGEKT